MSLARPLALGVATLGAVIALAGCGGGSDSLSADEFRSQADAICADANKKTDALAEPQSNDDVLAYLRAGLTVEAAQLSQLEDLKAPSDLEGTYSEALDLLKQKDAAITAAADRIEGGEDPEAVLGDVNDDIETLQDQANAKAKGLGLKVCGTEDDGTFNHVDRDHRHGSGNDDGAEHHRRDRGHGHAGGLPGRRPGRHDRAAGLR